MQRSSLFFAILFVLTISPVCVRIPSVKGESNLIVNGTFDSDLSGTWTIYRVTLMEPYPIVRREREANGNYYLYFDAPYPSEAYVQQGPINIPQSPKVLLSFKEWARYRPTEISVEVVDSTGKTTIVDDFYTEALEQLDGIRITKTYDLTQFANKSISLRFRVKSPFNTGITGIDDVRLAVGDALHPLIACEMARHDTSSSQESTPLPEYDVQPGENITLSGQIYPAIAVPLTVHYTTPNGNTSTQEVTSDRSGAFNRDFTPSSSGIWFVSVSPAQFAGTYYEGSCDTQFVVRGPSGIVPLQIVVKARAINVSNPVIEVKPGQLISGTVRVSVLDNLRFANFVVIGFDSWESNSWDLVMYGQGLEGDPTGLSWKYGLAPVPSSYDVIWAPRDKNLGSYVLNVSWSFPLSRDIGNEIQSQGNFSLIAPHPSLTAPSTPGEYYLVLEQDWVSSARELLQDQHPFTRTNWQKFVPPSRNSTNILALVVLVVDVDSHLNAAQKEIACENSYGGNTVVAEADYSRALQLESGGQYNASAHMADAALVAASSAVESFLSDINPNKVDALYYVSDNFVSLGNRNRISSEYDQFRFLLGGKAYCQARQLQDDMTNLATLDILTFIAYFLISIFGIGNIAAFVAERIYPSSPLEEKLHKILGRRLRGIHRLLAGIIAYGVIDILLNVFYSSFPLGGSLVLVMGVAMGWWLNKRKFTERILARLHRLNTRASFPR